MLPDGGGSGSMLPGFNLSLLLGGLLSGLGGFTSFDLGSGGLDDADGNGLPHVTDSEATQGREAGEGFDAHGLGRLQADDTGISGLDELGRGLGGFTGTTIDLLQDLSELAGNMGCVAIQHWRVSVADLSRVVEDDDLGGEVLHSARWLVLRVGCDVSTLDVLDGDVLDVESNVVSWAGLSERLVVHLYRLALSGKLDRREGDDVSGLQDSGLHTAHGHCSNSANFVNILKGQTKGFVGGSLRGNDGVEAL